MNGGLRGDASIIGIGASAFGRFQEKGVLELTSEALGKALADAGVTKDEIDGLIIQIGSPRGMDYDRVAEAFGLDVRFAAQTWQHGRFMATVITHAAMAVTAGLARCVACVIGYKNSNLPTIGEPGNPFFEEGNREGGGPHGEQAYAGMTAPGSGVALAWRLYCTRYGVDPKLLAEIPMAFRYHASLNPAAIMRKPITRDDYLSSPMIIEPLRRLDFSLINDGAVCALITTTDRARSLKRANNVVIDGAQGLKAGREHFIFAPDGLGLWQQSTNRLTRTQSRQQTVYEMSGVTPDDVDVFFTYDAFSPVALFALESFGFCEPGDGARWIQGGRIRLGGELPVNTNGGLLSEAHLNGWGHLVEMVRQLRNECGERQVKQAAIGLWGTVAGDALLLRRDA